MSAHDDLPVGVVNGQRDHAAHPSVGKSAERPCSESRALLERMLEVVREQRRYLIEGDIAGLAETSRLLETLVEMVGRPAGAGSPPHRPAPLLPSEQASALETQELRELTQQLRAEGHINYLLACRGMQFVDSALSVVRGRERAGAGPGASSEPVCVVDARS